MIFKSKAKGKRSNPVNSTGMPSAPGRKDADKSGDRIKALSRITSIMVGIAIIAAGYGLFTGLSSAQLASQVQGDTAPTLCAAVEIPAGTLITADMVVVKQVPSGALVSTPLADASLAVGQRALTTISAGMQITTSLFAGAGDTSKLTNNLGAGTVGVTITTDEENGLSGLLRQGDRVDIIVVPNDVNSPPTYIDGQARVVALQSTLTDSAKTYSSVTLAVTPGQAAQIAAAEVRDKIRIVAVSTPDAQ